MLLGPMSRTAASIAGSIAPEWWLPVYNPGAEVTGVEGMFPEVNLSGSRLFFVIKFSVYGAIFNILGDELHYRGFLPPKMRGGFGHWGGRPSGEEAGPSTEFGHQQPSDHTITSNKERTMDTHVKIAGWLWTILGALTLLGALCAVVSIGGGGLISGDPDAILATSITATVVGLFLVLSGAVNLIAGLGLLKYKGWARILALILAILNLLAFPIGTALGIYTLWVLLSKDTELLFQI
jgi:hypothetical protein